MIPRLLAALAAALAVCAHPVVAGDPPPAPRVDLEGAPPRLLSAYGFFQGPLAKQQPAPGVVAYDVNTELFSDYAHKLRFAYVPKGKRATFHPEHALAFPVGSVLIKTFAYPRAEGLRLIETRLLIHKTSGWVGLPYVWNAEQTDARLKVAGAVRPVEWTDAKGERRSLRYLVPNMNQCKVCHERGGTVGPVGPTARNLNDGAQLEDWKRRGILDGLPSEGVARLARWDDPQVPLPERARAYLEVNCAHCHDPRGAGNTAGLDLRAHHADRTKLGVMKAPVAAGRGAGGLRFGIVPGDPDGSIFVLRMASTDPGVMMPEHGRRLVHEEGLRLIRAWIEAMPRGG